ncbi:MAG: hypothetical protein U1F43_29765 [Myxococcota bacterium]
MQAILDELHRAEATHRADTESQPIPIQLPPPHQPAVVALEDLADLVSVAEHRLQVLDANGGRDSPAAPGAGVANRSVAASPELAQARTELQAQVAEVVNQANAVVDAYGAWLRANYNEFNRATAGATGSLGWGRDDFVQAINERLESAVSSAVEAAGEALEALGIEVGGILGFILAQAAERGANALVSALSRAVLGEPASREDRARDAARDAMHDATADSNRSIDSEVGRLRGDVARDNTRYTTAVGRTAGQSDVSALREHLAHQQAGLQHRAETLARPDLSMGQRMTRAWTMANAGGAHTAREGVDQHQWEQAQQRGLPGEQGIAGHYEAFIHGVRANLTHMNAPTAVADRMEAELRPIVTRAQGHDDATTANAVLGHFNHTRWALGVVHPDGETPFWAFAGMETETRWSDVSEVGPVTLELVLAGDGGAVVLRECRYHASIQGSTVRVGWGHRRGNEHPPTFEAAGLMDTLRGRQG